MTRDWRAEMFSCGLHPSVGNWLAGFVDGEGCFAIGRSGNGYACSFIIKLRADDRDALERTMGSIGHGRIYDIARSSPTRAPQASYQVNTKKGCLRIVDIFDEFPLRSKKARDFAIWREAVIFWSTVGGGGTDWTEMAGYFEAIKAGRAFVEAVAA